jgi:putative transposase
MSGRPRQLNLGLRERPSWGGRRRGAGRKPKGRVAGVPHVARPAHRRDHPVHVTLRVVRGLPNLRKKLYFRIVRDAIAAAALREEFGLVHYAVMSNHIHLIVEAGDRQALSGGVKGFEIRVARALNKLLRRKGGVFADRYHSRDLKSPREVRHALAYVLLNWNHHRQLSEAARAAIRTIDPCTSGAAFVVWHPDSRPIYPDELDMPGTMPRTYLLDRGWRSAGLLWPNEVPGERRWTPPTSAQ